MAAAVVGLAAFALTLASLWPRPSVSRGRDDAQDLARTYLARQRAAADLLPIADIFGDHRGPRGCTGVSRSAVYVPLDVAEVPAADLHDPAFRRLGFVREGQRALPVLDALIRSARQAGAFSPKWFGAPRIN